MVGRYKIIRGVPAAAAGALPKLNVSDLDKTLGGVTYTDGSSLLQYDINPAFLAPADGFTLAGKDRGSGKTVSAQRSAVSKISSEALFNGKPAVQFDTGSGDTAGWSSDLTVFANPTLSTTFFWVGTISSALKATPGPNRMICLVDPDLPLTLFSLTLLSSGNVIMGNSTSPTEAAIIPAANVPAANVPFVLAGSYYYTGNRFRIFLNGVQKAEASPPAQIASAANCRIGFGGPAGISHNNGWSGKMARADIFSRELSPAQIASISTALMAEYGIS